MKIFDAKDIYHMDSRFVAMFDKQLQKTYSVSTNFLMNNAGYQSALFIKSHHFKKILIVCGKGNNGGDGFATAIHLKELGISADILSLYNESTYTKETTFQYKKCLYLGIKPYTIDFINFSNYDCIVDGILGAGLRGSCKENILDVIQLINQSRKNVISLDIPTGLGTQTCVHPTQTITYGFPKKIFKTHYQFCGDIYCIDIEIPRLACLNLLKCSCNFFDESSIIKIRYIHE